LANEPSEFGPKTRAGSVDAFSAAGHGEVLARKASSQDIDGIELIGVEGTDVGVNRDSGPVMAQDALAEGVLLAEPGGTEACAAEPEVKSAHAGEKAADSELTGHGATFRSTEAAWRAAWGSDRPLCGPLRP